MRNFIKMNGAGNDFVIVDARNEPLQLSPEQVRALCARENAVTKGCDQVIVMEASPAEWRGQVQDNNKTSRQARDFPDCFMRIYNADGGEVDACGNATRCVAQLLYNELQRLPVTIQTNAGLLQGLEMNEINGQDYILVDMQAPQLEWQKIPLAMPLEEARESVEKLSGLKNPFFVSMGNPHVVFFIASEIENENALYSKELDCIDIVALGSSLEHCKEVFPQGVNVSVAIVGKYRVYDSESFYSIDAKVWERGAGATKACGTAACAMMVAANHLDSRIRDVHVNFLPSQQTVFMKISEHGHMLLGGFVATEFSGVVDV